TRQDDRGTRELKAGGRGYSMRRRATYANVMATLAFFFALTGGALAGKKYLEPSDPITQGDLAGSTYDDPVIADGAITSAKFATTAVAPNSTRLAGHGFGDFPLVVARLVVNVQTSPLTPGQCAGVGSNPAPGADPTTDVAIVGIPAGVANLSFTATVDQANDVDLEICNTF